jgi:hypothetical protein
VNGRARSSMGGVNRASIRGQFAARQLGATFARMTEAKAAVTREGGSPRRKSGTRKPNELRVLVSLGRLQKSARSILPRHVEEVAERRLLEGLG